MTAGIGAVGGAGGSVSALAQAYRNQLLAAADPAADGTAAAGSTASATPGGDFAGALGRSMTGLEALDKNTSALAVKAATGDLGDIQDYVIAATQAQVATQLTTTVRNKAVDAFNEIMRMPL
jgi:flagellar hook-basal body complex protein FliE